MNKFIFVKIIYFLFYHFYIIATCSYTYHLKNFRQLPTCDVDGTFAAVQCKGDTATGR